MRLTHADGSDLKFSVKGRSVLKDVGFLTAEDLRNGCCGLNLPAGEAFISPLEKSAFGSVKFEKIYAPGHGFVTGLRLEFDAGRVVDYSAAKGGENFRKYLAENTESTRTIGELGIGCNAGAKYSGYILTDEKIAGTVHIAIGNNTGAFHGKNKASDHLDMVKDMKRGVLWVDGKAVLKNGRPVK